MRRILILLLLLVAVLTGIAFVAMSESFTERLPGEVLLPGFVSHATRAEVLAVLGREVSLDVVEDSSPPADARPPFAIYTVEAKPMSCFGQPGSLRLSFFNDRLMEVRFFAADPKALLATLQEQGLPLVLGGEVERGCVRIAAGVDFAGRSYVAWQDARMVRQKFRWIRRYS